MDNFNNDNINVNDNANTQENANTTPNYNAQIYSEPVPQPAQFNSGASYGSEASNNNYSAPNYTAPSYIPPSSDLEEPMSLGEWIGTILLCMIPCVNIVLLFVWAFSSGEKKSKSNYAKAVLIISGIIIAIYIVLIIAFAAIGISFLSRF